MSEFIFTDLFLYESLCSPCICDRIKYHGDTESIEIHGEFVEIYLHPQSGPHSFEGFCAKTLIEYMPTPLFLKVDNSSEVK